MAYRTRTDNTKDRVTDPNEGKTYYAGIGWVDNDAWQGPRTHYEDGTPVADFSYRNDWDPNWSIRLNDIYRWGGGQHGGAGRTMLSEDQLGYSQLNDPYWRTEEGRNWINQQAISGRSLEEIYREMSQMGERSDKLKELWSGDNPLTSGDTRGGFLEGYRSRRDDATPTDAATGDDGMQFVSGIGWTKTGPMTEEDRELTRQTAEINSGFDELDTKWGRVARTGINAWERGGDLMDWIGDAEGNYDGMSFDRLYAAYGGLNEYGQAPVMNPLIDTIWHDQQDILNMYNSEDFNPYYSPHHQTKQHRDRLREMGNDRHSLSSFDNRKQGNIMDYLYAKTKGQDKDTIAKRGDVMKKWQAYSNGADWNALYNQRMTESTYNQMGLQDILGDYDKDFNKENYTDYEKKWASHGGMTGGTSGKSKGFLQAYRDRRDQLNNRPSVKSLFKEMGDYAEE